MSINKIEPVGLFHTPQGWDELQSWIELHPQPGRAAVQTAALMAWNLAAAIQRNQPEPMPDAAQIGLPDDVRARREAFNIYSPDAELGTFRTVAALCGQSVGPKGEVDAAFSIMWDDARRAGAFDNCGNSYGEIAAALLLHRAAKFLK